MGKRKLHGTTFYQCDWTGFPMKAQNCYMPFWVNGKLLKKGCYFNWESVVAHAMQLHAGGAQLQPILDHIHMVTGTHVHAAPHWNELAHTKGQLNAKEFHDQCTLNPEPITAVKIAPTGEVFEVVMIGGVDSTTFEQYLHKPYNNEPLATFHSMRKKGCKLTDRSLCVFYYPSKGLPPNPTASNAFKMQLYGDVLLVNQSNEASAIPRDRYVPFTKAAYDDLFHKKRKRNEQSSLAPDQYAQMKDTMQQAFNSFEATVATDAAKPRETMKALQVTKPTKSLASCLKDRAGYVTNYGGC